MSRNLRIVGKDESEEPDVDPDLVKLAHSLLGAVASGEVHGFIVAFEGEDGMDWGWAGEFCPYAFQTFIHRRIGELLDEVEGEGEEC